MNCRRANRKVTTKGVMMTTAAAITTHQFVPASTSAKYTIPAGGVYIFELWTTINGQKKSFQ